MAEIKQIVLAIVFFSALLTGILNFSGDIFNNYGNEVVNSTAFSKLEQTQQEVQAQQNTYTTQNTNETKESIQDLEGAQFLGSASLYRTVINTFGAANTFISATATMISISSGLIPNWVQTLVAGILIVLVIFGAVRIIFGGV